VNRVVQDYAIEHNTVSLEKLVQEYLPAADSAMRNLSDIRQQRGKGFPNRAQRFVTTFLSFLGCYSQVVSLMNAANSQSWISHESFITFPRGKRYRYVNCYRPANISLVLGGGL
jgi:hypothetical protein